MRHSPEIVSNALFQSLIEGSLLMQDLPEGVAFRCDSLVMPEKVCSLNLEQKLGYLYEDALWVMLESTPRYECLERGLQIRRETGETLGELDFLVRDLSSDQLIHLELAVKFYLAVETADGFLLPGPDARDNYYRKLKKMRLHQLLLTEKFPELLPESVRDEAIIVQQLVQGCIFDHVNASRPVEAEFLNPIGRRGKWLLSTECAEYFGSNAQLEIIPKPLWPVPFSLMEGIDLDRWDVDEEITRCLMVRSNGGNLPYFIAPSEYPSVK